MVADRYTNPKYAQKHSEACKRRSANLEYRRKLSKNAARGELHAIKTSCGIQGIPVEDFSGFITGRDVIEREHCKMTVGKECLSKANYICIICGNGGYMNAHHKNGWHWAIDERFDINNLVCLCHGCHSQFHKEYGNKNNIKQQFEEFKQKRTGK
jgi:hypothetical protein